MSKPALDGSPTCWVCDEEGTNEIGLCVVHAKCECGKPATDCCSDRGICDSPACQTQLTDIEIAERRDYWEDER